MMIGIPNRLAGEDDLDFSFYVPPVLAAGYDKKVSSDR